MNSVEPMKMIYSDIQLLSDSDKKQQKKMNALIVNSFKSVASQRFDRMTINTSVDQQCHGVCVYILSAR